MFKRINKLSRRFGKKKPKDPSPSSSQNDVTKLDVPHYSDDTVPHSKSMPELCDGDPDSLKVSAGKGIDLCNNETPCDDIETIPVTTSSEESISQTAGSRGDDMSIRIEDLQNVYNKKHADEDRLFREEMKGISTYVSKNPSTCEYAKLPQNREKNRYKNIVTSDKARVVLERINDDPFSDYINASYIDGYTKKRKFIATQGPKPSTVNDFWRMVWEHGLKVIVMVTDFRESGKPKCERYFPEEGVMECGNICVETTKVTSYGGYHQRTLAVSLSPGEVYDNDSVQEVTEKTEEPEVRYITHLQCKRWPDHGVPKSTSAIFRLHQKMLDSQPEDCDTPILVHCSAGVGRTGTLVGLDNLISQLATEKLINVHDTVVKMREQRTEMVQSMDQYVLLHKLILEHHYLGNTDYNVADFEKHLEEMNKVDEESGKTKFESEFELLSLVPPQNARFSSGSMSHNASKNRDEKVIPYEHSQVFIRMRPTEMRPPYVNASTLLGYDDTVNLIAAQDPLPSLLEDFWRVIIDNYVTCIVMLAPTIKDEIEYCPQYWPSDDVMEFGDITIKHEESVDHDDFVETRLTILTDDREKLGRSITHLHYKNWLENQPPPDRSDVTILDIIAHVDKHKRNEENGGKTRVLVHCSDGAGITGSFCAVVNLVQRLKCENKVDVFRAIKDLRDCRPGMVKTVDQYKFCHDAIATYLRSFDLYSNGR
ncbi:receptor-type tyrosine-protein phosphatase alpha-like isoform X1 [Styela clava]